MREYGCTVLLKHEEATAFFLEARRPDMDALRRRDHFLAEIQRELSPRKEGTDLVATIPDIDIAALMAPPVSYRPAESFFCAVSMTIGFHEVSRPARAGYTLEAGAKTQAA